MSQFIHDNDTTAIQWKKDGQFFSINSAGSNGEKRKLCPYLKQYTKINARWIIYPKVQVKQQNMQKKTREIPSGPQGKPHFFKQDKGNTDNLNLIKLRNSV